MWGKALVSKKFFVPLALLLWLLVSLTFMLLIPRADATDPTTGCPSDETEAMDQVYNPQRLRILNLCQEASGTVTFFEEWSDGDWNVYVDLDAGSENLVNAPGINNIQAWQQGQGADMIWEAIPRDLGPCDPNPGDLGPAPSAGESLRVRGVYVYDKWHQWYELHPLVQITHINPDGSDGQICTRS